MMRIAIGCDHGGYAYKQKLTEHLRSQGHQVEDTGCHSLDSVDYPDYARLVSDIVAAGDAERGILICRTGIGMSMTANKVQGIRCALCAETVSARLTREHNDANVLAMGAAMIGYSLAEEIADVWLSTEFLGGRHMRRVNKIMAAEAR